MGRLTSQLQIRGLTVAVPSWACFLSSLFQFLIYKMEVAIALTS